MKAVLYIRLGAFLVHGTFDIDGEESRRLFVGGREWGEEQLAGACLLLAAVLNHGACRHRQPLSFFPTTSTQLRPDHSS